MPQGMYCHLSPRSSLPFPRNPPVMLVSILLPQLTTVHLHLSQIIIVVLSQYLTFSILLKELYTRFSSATGLSQC